MEHGHINMSADEQVKKLLHTQMHKVILLSVSIEIVSHSHGESVFSKETLNNYKIRMTIVNCIIISILEQISKINRPKLQL